ncbi:hypothetical protein SLE2022_405860 [Rubroshorea leprosula]
MDLRGDLVEAPHDADADVREPQVDAAERLARRRRQRGGRAGLDDVGGVDVRLAAAARQRAAMSASPSPPRAASIRRQPLAANAMAVAAPMPLDAPVITALRPASDTIRHLVANRPATGRARAPGSLGARPTRRAYAYVVARRRGGTSGIGRLPLSETGHARGGTLHPPSRRPWHGLCSSSRMDRTRSDGGAVMRDEIGAGAAR